MKKAVLFSAMGCWPARRRSPRAEEVGRVISSTPVIQQVAVPRQVCNNQPVAVQQPNSGAGAVMGAIAGGALGNAIGHGGGRAAATVIGLVGGAGVGNSIEGSGSYVQNVQQCTHPDLLREPHRGLQRDLRIRGQGTHRADALRPGRHHPAGADTDGRDHARPPAAEAPVSRVPGTAVGVIVGTPPAQP